MQETAGASSIQNELHSQAGETQNPLSSRIRHSIRETLISKPHTPVSLSHVEVDVTQRRQRVLQSLAFILFHSVSLFICQANPADDVMIHEFMREGGGGIQSEWMRGEERIVLNDYRHPVYSDYVRKEDFVLALGSGCRAEGSGVT